MNTYKSKYIIAFIFIIFGSRVANIYGQVQCHNIRLDIENARGGGVSEYVSQIDFIPLETNKKAMVGSINQLEFVGDTLFILDNVLNTIHLYKTNGSYLHSIDNSSKLKLNLDLGYISRYITVDLKRKLILQDYHHKGGQVLLTLDYDGNLIQYDTINSIPNNLYYISDSTYFEYYTYSDITAQNNAYGTLVVTQRVDSSQKAINAMFPVRVPEHFARGYPGDIYFDRERSVLLMSRVFDYTLYLANKDSIFKEVKFMLPLNYAYPSHVIDSGSTAEDDYIHDPINSNKIYGLGDLGLLQNDKYVFAPMSHPFRRIPYIFSEKSGVLVSFERLTSDSLSYDLPIYTTQEIPAIIRVSGNYIWTYIYASELYNITSKWSNDKINKLPQAVKMLLSKPIPAQENPILIRLKVKDF